LPSSRALTPHRTTCRGASEFSAVWNIVCTIAGVGILSLPKAMADGGWVATIVLVLSAVIADYTGKLLIEAMYAGRDGTRLAGGFPEIGYAAYGNTGYYLVQFFHKTTLVGVCTLFLILAGDYVNSIIHYFAGQYVLSPTLWSLFIGVVVWVPLVTLKTVKEVAFVRYIAGQTDRQRHTNRNTPHPPGGKASWECSLRSSSLSSCSSRPCGTTIPTTSNPPTTRLSWPRSPPPLPRWPLPMVAVQWYRPCPRGPFCVNAL